MNCCNTSDPQHNYKDVIPVFLGDFKKDFDCKDIEETLRTILKKKEVDDIVKLPKSKQIYRLFWTLRDQQTEIVKKFVEDGLKDSHDTNYGFLMTAIQKECCEPSLNTENYICEVDRLYNDNQKFTKYNVSRIEPHLELQKALLELRPSKNVVVEGVLGAGKQWLALDVCSSYAVQRKMDFKIFWLNVGTCSSPESCLRKLQSFLYQIDPDLLTNCDKSVLSRIELIKIQLRRKLQDKFYKNCLLVLRDVQNKETWEAFNLGCKILLTTRHKSVVHFLSSTTTTHVNLKDALTPFEMESLFEKYLSGNVPKLLKELTSALIDDNKTNPLHLSIIAKSIRDGLCTLDNWKNIKSVKLTTIIKNSLNVLEPNERQLYEALFIFPDSAHIPIRLLGIVWSVEDPMIIVNKLYKYSLVNKHLDNKNQLTITLPGIYKELNLPINNEAALNKKIIKFYNIPQLFEQCDDLTIPLLDSYFFSHIDHHLSKLDINFERVYLFRKIFLDFRFLEQKIRNDITPWCSRGSVLHTLHILKSFKREIADNDRYYVNLLNSLLDFLPSAEEKLIRSQFTCLLQIALMAEDGVIYDEAHRQVQRFPDYVWFTESGRFHQHRQIINLGKDEVQHAIYLDNDFCLMALNTQQLLLTDVSLEGDTAYLLSDENDPCDIIEMRVFNKQLHLLTLHSNGNLKLWSLRELLRRRQSYGTISAVRPQICQVTKSKSLCYEQLVNSVIKRSDSKPAKQNISSFFLDEKCEEDNTFIQLHVAFSDGDICICDWENKEEKFKQSHTPILKTNQHQVRCFSKILKRFYVLCTVHCKITVWDLRCESKEAERVFYNDEAVAMETYIDRVNDGSMYTIILLIFKSSVWRLRFKHAEFNTITTLQQEALKISNIGSASITCGRLSRDGCYLVLGSLEGLFVYDLKLSDIVLRSNVSEKIVCLDVYDLNGPIFKYIILCGAAGKSFLHLHTLRSCPGIGKPVITWDHNAKRDYALTLGTKADTQAHLEPNVFLRPLLTMSDNGTLFTVDSKSYIYQIQPGIGKNYNSTYWSTIKTPQMGENTYITALYAFKNNTIYAGYNNGTIINIAENKKLLQDNVTGQIDYLKVVNSKILLASDRSEYNTFIFSISSLEANSLTIDWTIELQVYTMYAQLFDERFLLIFSEMGVYYIDLSNRKPQQIEKPDDLLVGFDLKDKLLFLAFKDSTIRVYELGSTADKLNFKLLCNENIRSQSIINSLAVSNDGKIISIGFRNGHIGIYTFEDAGFQRIHTITQGHEPCHEMKLCFSPCKQILVSCAELLCFWNVKHMLNNRATTYCLSRRHNHSQFHSNGCEEVDACPWLDVSDDQKYVKQSAPLHGLKSVQIGKAYLWMDKRGITKLPELLASIKYVGTVARRFYTSVDFTQFFAIDDEGVFYHLKVLEYLSQNADAIGSTHPLRKVDHKTGINQTENLTPPVGDVDCPDNEGIDVVGNFISSISLRTDGQPDVI